MRRAREREGVGEREGEGNSSYQIIQTGQALRALHK